MAVCILIICNSLTYNFTFFLYSNSANGGSVNSQDSLWNVKGVPPAVPQSHDPNLIHQQMMHNAYQMQAQGYTVYDAMAMQQQQQLQQQQQQQQQQVIILHFYCIMILQFITIIAHFN